MASNAGGTGRIRMELLTTPQEGWNALLEEYFQEEIGRVLKVEASAVPLDKPLTEIGLDSLSSFELKNRIDAELEIDIPVSKFLQTPTINGLTGVIVECFLEEMRAIEAAEAAAALDANNSGDISGDADIKNVAASEVFVPSDRQIYLTSLAGQRMTSASSVQALLHHLEFSVTPALDRDILREAISKVATNHLALRIKLDLDNTQNRSGRKDMPFALDGTPSFVSHDSWPKDPVALDPTKGELMRFDLYSPDAAHSRLSLTAHACVVDEYSLSLIINELVQVYQGLKNNYANCPGDITLSNEIVASEKKLLALLNARQFNEQSHSALGDRAFWYETLDGDYPLVSFGPRAHAVAPAGLGRNQGRGVNLDFDIDLSGLERSSKMEREVMLLSALGQAIVDISGQSNLIINRADIDRLDDQGGDMIGAIGDELPLPFDSHVGADFRSSLERVNRLLRAGILHRNFSIEACETQFVAQLRANQIDPRQVKFSYIETASSLGTCLGLDGRNITNGETVLRNIKNLHSTDSCINDLAMTALYNGSGSRIRLRYDRDNVSPEIVLAIAKRLRAHLVQFTDQMSVVTPNVHATESLAG